jgi:hypothetical protein
MECPGAPFKRPRTTDVCTMDDTELAMARRLEDKLVAVQQAALDKRKAEIAARRADEDARRAAFWE